MKNTLWIVGLIIVGIGLLFLIGNSTSTIADFQVGVLSPLDNVKGLKPVGSTTPPVFIAEYSDFECPACRAYYPIVRQIVQEYGDRVTLAYRHFPLTSIHPNAEFAARAAQAAAKQGKFWEMHDLLFEKQDEWAREANVEPIFASYATLIGINVDQFKNDWVSKDVKDFVKGSRLHSIKIGLQGTPTFFINGKKIENPKSFDEFKLIIEQALKDSRGL